MLTKTSKNLLITSLAVLISLSLPVSTLSANSLGGIISPRPDSPTDSIPVFLTGIVNILLGMSGALAFLFIVIGGLQMVTSTGNPQKLETAKKTLTYAIVGLLAVILSYTIFQFIINFASVITG